MKPQILSAAVKLVLVVVISVMTMSAYHTFIIKKHYVPRSEIYVVDTNKILQSLAERVYNKTLTTDELRGRVEELQMRINNHKGLVFEMGALPGRIDNDIQHEFEDIIKR